MTDRTGDCANLLEGHGMEKKALKCCAHIILGINYAIDKVFQDKYQDTCVEVDGCIHWAESIPLTIYFDPQSIADCISKVDSKSWQLFVITFQ